MPFVSASAKGANRGYQCAEGDAKKCAWVPALTPACPATLLVPTCLDRLITCSRSGRTPTPDRPDHGAVESGERPDGDRLPRPARASANTVEDGSALCGGLDLLIHDRVEPPRGLSSRRHVYMHGRVHAYSNARAARRRVGKIT